MFKPVGQNMLGHKKHWIEQIEFQIKPIFTLLFKNILSHVVYARRKALLSGTFPASRCPAARNLLMCIYRWVETTFLAATSDAAGRHLKYDPQTFYLDFGPRHGAVDATMLSRYALIIFLMRPLNVERLRWLCSVFYFFFLGKRNMFIAL